MSEKNFLDKTPGVTVFKDGEVKMNNFGRFMEVDGAVSGLVDVPVSETERPVTMGYFSMTPSEGFDFEYTYLEIKVIIRGKFVISDEDGTKHVLEPGDVVVISPTTTVRFHGESDGHAFIVAHREAIPELM